MSDLIVRLNAALEGRYRIERELGQGGMATVYLADDLRHERKVALKVLRPELAAVVGAERFLAEIKTTANLQHPHVLPLFDSGEAGGFLFYAMPYLEGESLRERLDREHQLPVDEAVRIATNVAEALDYAHRHGVIHRDVKPANILLLDGKPVLSDFGIALAVGVAGAGRLTETGLSLGTPHYMSPEQATGDQTVGQATDIYALGCVMYEMLVGEPPYTGSTPQAVLGKIVTSEPDSVTEHRRSTPANVDASIRRALEKVAADRFATAQAFADALGDRTFRHGQAAAALAAASSPVRVRLAVGYASALVLALALGWVLLRSEPPQAIERFELGLPEDVTPFLGATHHVAVSPDGSRIVFVGQSADGRIQLWLRPLSELLPSPIPGTLNGANPRFSPDGRSLAFTSLGSLRTVSLTGVPPQTIASDSVRFGGIAWGPDGWIYFSGRDRGIWRVPEGGGEAEPITTPESAEGVNHSWPDVLPNGRGVLFTRTFGGRSSPEIAVVSLETGVARTLFEGAMARYARSGHILYTSPHETLLAASFDPRRMEPTGPANSVVDAVHVRGSSASYFAISETGTLVYLPALTAAARQRSRLAELVSVTRAGEATPLDPDWQFVPGPGFWGFSLSPDGTRVAVSAEVEDNADIWIKQLPDGPFERLTFDVEAELHPAWTPDGDFVTYLRGGEDGGLWRKRADGTGTPELLLRNQPALHEGTWSPDGEWIVGRTQAPTGTGGLRDIVGFRPRADGALMPLIADPEAQEQNPSLSRDGAWLAYASAEGGLMNVYVNPFPDVDAGRVRVSADGGMHPLWAGSGNEIFFRDIVENVMVAAQVEADREFRVLRRETLFSIGPEYLWGAASSSVLAITPDDQRFIMARSVGLASARADRRYVVVQNFFEELKRLPPAD